MSDRKSLGWFSHFGWGPAQGQECTLGHAKETVRIAGSLMRCCTFTCPPPRILAPTPHISSQGCTMYSGKSACFSELFKKVGWLSSFLLFISFLSTLPPTIWAPLLFSKASLPWCSSCPPCVWPLCQQERPRFPSSPPSSRQGVMASRFQALHANSRLHFSLYLKSFIVETKNPDFPVSLSAQVSTVTRCLNGPGHRDSTASIEQEGKLRLCISWACARLAELLEPLAHKTSFWSVQGLDQGPTLRPPVLALCFRLQVQGQWRSHLLPFHRAPVHFPNLIPSMLTSLTKPFPLRPPTQHTLTHSHAQSWRKKPEV
jgi:hypothetical protein